MRTVLAIILIAVPWSLIAPWIAKGYGEWHWPNPFTGSSGALVDGAVFYLPPLFVLALIARKFHGKPNAPNP
jgi:hypothetical protein